jgi:hypothetical protein
MVRYWLVGPSRQYVEDSWNGHERIVEGWRKAVEAAERASADGYWPVHLNGELACYERNFNTYSFACFVYFSLLILRFNHMMYR